MCCASRGAAVCEKFLFLTIYPKKLLFEPYEKRVIQKSGVCSIPLDKSIAAFGRSVPLPGIPSHK